MASGFSLHVGGLGLACAVSACLAARPPDDAQRGIEQVLGAQQVAWNRGDVEAYMSAGYLRSPSLTFFSGGDDTRGFDPVLERYKKRYTEGDNEMGRLEFSALETIPLEGPWALARGRWHLDLERREDIGGLFTLLFQRTSAGWRIVHDHTSVAGS